MQIVGYQIELSKGTVSSTLNTASSLGHTFRLLPFVRLSTPSSNLKKILVFSSSTVVSTTLIFYRKLVRASGSVTHQAWLGHASSLARSRNTTYYLTLQLAIANTLASMSLLPININLFVVITTTRVYCALVNAQRYFSLFLSFYLMAFISAERCWAAIAPLNPPRGRTLRRSVAGVWVLRILLALPPSYFLPPISAHDGCHVVNECNTLDGAIGVCVLEVLEVAIAVILISGSVLLCYLSRVAAERTYSTAQMVKTFRDTFVITIATMTSVLAVSAPLVVFVIAGVDDNSLQTRGAFYSAYVIISCHVVTTPVITILGYRPNRDKFKKYICMDRTYMYDFKVKHAGKNAIMLLDFKDLKLSGVSLRNTQNTNGKSIKTTGTKVAETEASRSENLASENY
ncbi:predicted protein [Nematostella vectensis]|uniref:G-protein coupled receptors family 1 profile domain-containing protein n=1 Tax=Nematostella vectensis TaxID=45351 RepID=A7T612_NEMVE|nr:predicted protein [Nematostella vectensis]|eukprot:XP_001620695.1 hypothetical protein NEMVEDRAFT_v1g222816 [Nematostella vectensis]